MRSSRGRHVAQPVAEDLRIARTGGLFLEDGAADRIERAGPVPGDRVGLGRRVALALGRDDVQELRSLALAHVAQRRHQRAQVVAVDGSDVVEAHFLEQRAGQHHALDVFLGSLGELTHRRHLLQHTLAAFAQLRVGAPGQHAREVLRHRADVFGDRHVVVVQDDEQVGGQRAGMVQRLEGHAAGQGAIADDRDCAPLLALQ